MEVVGYLAGGFGIALQPVNLLAAFGGVVLGTVVGMLPGIGPINAIAVLTPFTFASGMGADTALIMLVGIYYGSQFGNSISTILLNVPGTPSAVVTALDGYAMTRKGRGGAALAVSAVASFTGGMVSLVGLVLFAPILSRWAIRFGPAEYFGLMLFAFAALTGLAGRHLGKALVALGLGLLLASVGIDPLSAVPRFTFGQLKLLDGLDFVVVTIGLFAVSELFVVLEEGRRRGDDRLSHDAVRIGRDDLRRTAPTMARGSVVGFLTGVLPGAGGTIASFLSYSIEKSVAGRGGRFGEGDVRGVAAPESANNAAATGSLVPLLTLGVPGSGTTAVLLGALMGLNVTPGPLLVTQRPDVFWGLAASMVVGNIFLLILNLPLVGVFVRVLRAPRWALMSGVAGLTFVAVYAVNQSSFDLVLVTMFGLLGYGLRKAEVPLAPIVLGVVLGPLMERSLRRSLALSGGDWSVLWSSPIAMGLWVMSLVAIVLPMLPWLSRRLRPQRTE